MGVREGRSRALRTVDGTPSKTELVRWRVSSERLFGKNAWRISTVSDASAQDGSCDAPAGVNL